MIDKEKIAAVRLALAYLKSDKVTRDEIAKRTGVNSAYVFDLTRDIKNGNGKKRPKRKPTDDWVLKFCEEFEANGIKRFFLNHSNDPVALENEKLRRQAYQALEKAAEMMQIVIADKKTILQKNERIEFLEKEVQNLKNKLAAT